MSDTNIPQLATFGNVTWRSWSIPPPPVHQSNESCTIPNCVLCAEAKGAP